MVHVLRYYCRGNLFTDVMCTSDSLDSCMAPEFWQTLISIAGVRKRYCSEIESCKSKPMHQKFQLVGHPEPEKKNLLAFLSTFWHPCSKCILMCFKKDRGGCQVWKCPKVPELGQRSTECKFLYIRQNLAFLSNSYPKL